MMLLSPLAGLILAAALIPPLLLLYFLRLKRKPQTIASTLLWSRSVEDLRANAPFQRLRPSWLLFLQLLAILLLAFSIMQPQLARQESRGGRTILLIDNSASMNATDASSGSATRLEEAKARAKDRVEQLYAGGPFSGSKSETMVIAFNASAEVMTRFTDSRDQLFRSIDAIQATDATSMLGDALELARAYTTNTDPETEGPRTAPATLEIFSDGSIADLDAQVRRGDETVEYHRLGTPDAANLSVTSVSLQRPFNRPTAIEVFASLLNHTTEERAVDVELVVDGTIRAVQEVTLPAASEANADAGAGAGTAAAQVAAGRRSVVFSPFEQPRGARIEVRMINAADALPDDDVARIVAPPPRPLSVLLVTQRNSLVWAVIQGLDLAERKQITPDDWLTLQPTGSLDRYDVVVFEGWGPPADQELPPGSYLFLGALPALEAINGYGEGDAQVAIRVDRDHAALRHVQLDDLLVQKPLLVTASPRIEVLVRGSESPLVIALDRGPVRTLTVCFDPVDSNWPLLRSFVTFLFNAIEDLGHSGDALARSGLNPGDAIATSLPTTARDVNITLPGGQTLPAQSVDPTRFSWGPTRRGGFHRVTWTGEGETERDFAVNIAGEAEGSIGATEAILFANESVEGVAASRAAYTSLWPWAVAICIVLLMIEWFVYTQKTMV